MSIIRIDDEILGARDHVVQRLLLVQGVQHVRADAHHQRRHLLTAMGQRRDGWRCCETTVRAQFNKMALDMCAVLALTHTMCAPYVDILIVNIIQKLR